MDLNAKMTVHLGRLWQLLPYAIVFLLALQQFLAQVPKSAYRVDETGWTWAAVRVAGLVEALDFRPSAWQAEEDLGYGSINPQLGKLLFAIPIVAGCVPMDTHMPEKRVYWDLTLSLAENTERGAVMPPEILYPLRRVSAVLGACLCVVCMAMVHRARGRLAAFIAGLALAWNPLLANVSSSVLTDISYQLFLFASALPVMALAGGGTSREGNRRSVAAGILGGLATSCKYSAPFFLLPYALLMMLLMRSAGRLNLRAMYLSAFLLCGAMVGVVYLINPLLWPDPQVSPGGVHRDLRLWREGELHLAPGEKKPEWMWMLELGHQREDNDEGGVVLRLTPEAHAALRDFVFNTALATAEHPVPQLRPQSIMPDLFGVLRPAQLPWIYLRWVYFKEWVECDPQWLHASPSRFWRYLRYMHLSYSWEYWAACVGVLVLLLARRGESRYWLSPPRALLLFAVVYVAVLYLTRVNDMDRYLVGMIVLRSMLGAVGLTAVAAMGIRAARWAWEKRLYGATDEEKKDGTRAGGRTLDL